MVSEVSGFVSSKIIIIAVAYTCYTACVYIISH